MVDCSFLTAVFTRRHAKFSHWQVEGKGTGVVVKNRAGDLIWALEGYVVNMAGMTGAEIPSLREYLRKEGNSAMEFGQLRASCCRCFFY